MCAITCPFSSALQTMTSCCQVRSLSLVWDAVNLSEDGQTTVLTHLNTHVLRNLQGGATSLSLPLRWSTRTQRSQNTQVRPHDMPSLPNFESGLVSSFRAGHHAARRRI